MSNNHTDVRFPPLDPDEMTSHQRSVADAIMKGRKSLSGPFNATLRSPELADPMQQIGAYLRFKSPAEQRLKELAIIMVARFWSAEFEWHIHRGLAEAAGLDPAKADAIMVGRTPGGLDPDEAAIYRFVGQLLTSGKVSDAAFDSLKSRLGERLVTDFIGLCGYYSSVSFFLNVDRHPSPQGAEPLPMLAHPPFPDIEP